MNSVILVGCFTPLVIIFIVMKLAVCTMFVLAEQDYVKRAALYLNFNEPYGKPV